MHRSTAIAAALLGLMQVLPGNARAQLTLDETDEVHWQDPLGADLASRAAELGSAVEIYQFVRDDYRHAIYHGAVSSSGNTFYAGRGNDVDLASLLIAMLRSQAIEAQYAVGTVRIPAGDLTAWLGVDNFDLAHALLADAGMPKLVKDPGDAHVDLEHTWVRALLPWEEYRGLAPVGSANCTADPTPCAWVDLDPSFKRLEFSQTLLDVHDDLDFDYETYYNADNPAYTPPAGDTIEREGKNPLEIWEEQILAHLRSRDQGESLDDVARVGRIVHESAGVLPASLPYQVLGAVEEYPSVAARGEGTSRTWTKMVTLKMYFNGSSESAGATEIDAGAVTAVQASRYRLAIAYEGGATPRMVTRLDDQDPPVAVPIEIGVTTTNEGDPIFVGNSFSLLIERDSNVDVRSVEYEDNVVAGYFVIGSGDETSNHARTHQAAQELLDANDAWAIVLGPGDVPHVDLTGDGWDPTDPALWEHPDAMRDLTGGLLEVASAYYMAEGAAAKRRIDALNHTASLLATQVILVSTVFDVEYVAETPFEVLPLGLLINASWDGYGPFRVADANTFSRKSFDLWAHMTSSLEHEVWQEVVSYQAISTTSGIQKALESGAALLDVEVSETVDTMQGNYGSFDFTQTLPSGYTLHSFPMYGATQWTFTANGSALDFAMMRENIDVASLIPAILPAYYMTPDVANGNHDYVQSFHDAPAILQSMIDGGQVFLQPEDLGGCTAPGFIPSIFPSYLINWVETCYFHNLEQITLPSSSGDGTYTMLDVYAFLQSENGFGPSGTVYRSEPPPDPNKHTWGFVGNAHATLYSVVPGYTNRLVTPDAPTQGPTFRFQVHILQRYSANDVFGMSFLIENDIGNLVANGGYTAGDDPLDPESDVDDFDNTRFTDNNLITPLNNHQIITPSTADPISVVTGNMYLDETDMVLKSRGMNITFTRTYNSSSIENSPPDNPLSPGWTHSFMVALEANDYGPSPDDGNPIHTDGETSTISFRDERGGELNYLVSSPAWTPQPPPGTFDQLELDTSPGEHTLTFRNGVKYIFEGPNLRTPGDQARLMRIEDPYGNAFDFSYNGNGELLKVDDGIGGGMNFLHAGGKLRVVFDSTSRAVTLGYDVNGNLDSVEDAEGHIRTYTYVPGTSQLEDVVLPADRDGDGNGGDVRTQYTYYRNGRAFGNVNALGQGETLEYDYHEKRTRVTDPRDFVREYKFDRHGLLTKLREPDGAVLLFGNTDDFMRMSKINGLGYETRYSYQLDRSISSAPSTSFGNVTLEEDPAGRTTEYDYDFNLFDHVTRVKDWRGNQVFYDYYQTTNGSGAALGKRRRVRADVGAFSNVTLMEYEYAPNGNLEKTIEYIDPTDLSRKRETFFAYDARDLNVLTRTEIGEDTNVVTYTYDALDRVQTQTITRRASPSDSTPVDLTVIYEYDQLDRIVQVTDPLGNSRETVYDDNGKVESIIDHRKRPDESVEEVLVASYRYDEADRPVAVMDYYGHEKAFEYDAAGNLTRITNGNGHSLGYEYDAMGRLVAIVNENGHRVEHQYDLAGRRTRTTDANGHATTYVYDRLGRLAERRDPLDHVARFSWDENGNQTGVTDPNATAGLQPLNQYGETVTFAYDQLNRLTRVTDALNGVTQYEFDLLGNHTLVRDAENRETEFRYDDNGQLREFIDPIEESPGNDKTVTLDYDESGNIIRSTDRKGQVIEYTYDLLNRLERIDFLNDGTARIYSYDMYGNLESIQGVDVAYSFEYDKMHRVERLTDQRTGESMVYEYDDAGNVERKTDLLGRSTSYQYDGSNRLVSIEHPDFLHASYHYDPAGRLLDRILSNGSRTAYRFDEAGRLTELSNFATDGSAVSRTSYAYDRAANVDGITDLLASETTDYVYDPLYRLENVLPPNPAQDILYEYDKVGNRRKETNAGAVRWFIYDDANRLEEIHADTETGPLLNSFAYDDNGNLEFKYDASMQPLLSFVYDSRDRVTQIDAQGAISTFAYDPYGFRIQKLDSAGEKNYFLEGEHLELVRSAAGQLIARFFRGVKIDEVLTADFLDVLGKITNRLFHYDEDNSVSGLSDPSGDVVTQTSYAPFGEVASGQVGPDNFLGFTGREFDPDTSLYYFRSRYYDPDVGRFLSEDPFGFRAGVNFYAFAGNNPIGRSDPLGTDAIVNVGPPNPATGIIDVTIEIPITYSGPGATPTVTNAWNTAIQNAWSGTFGNYNVTTTVTSGTINQITVPLGNSTAYVVGGNAGTWPSQRPGTTAEHEAGHLLGLPNQYYWPKTGGSAIANPGHAGNIMGPCCGVPFEQDIKDITADTTTNTVTVSPDPFLSWLPDPIVDFFIAPLLDYVVNPFIDYVLTPIYDFIIAPVIDFFFEPTPLDTGSFNFGGFVVYPNQPNTNMAKRVYSK